MRDTQKGGGGALVVHAGAAERGDLRVGEPVRSSHGMPLHSMGNHSTVRMTFAAADLIWLPAGRGNC